ncbi:transcription termination factor 2 isoform X2 [Sebastes umbrosus]|uniref:transcription termination factor 2 isoform X2 n=1 Tax=Sebastes umbrosus TaxID=72105 RepID=UPI00189E010F|nr:transcription termination factor 2 isoform X2 [Sebastes umbrosus]
MYFLTAVIGRYENANFYVQILCNIHGSLCMLKTGVRDGPTKGKSFYVCVDKQGCDFSHVASVSPSHCLQHEDSMVDLQALSYSLQQQSHRLYYRCVAGKKAGQRWCGNLPWTAPPEKEKRNPLSDTQLQPSCLPPVRNPFKAPDKTDKDSEWRRMQRGGGDEKRSKEKDSEASHKAEGREGYQKENVESVGAGAEEEEEEAGSSAVSYRGKQLPPGMKLKKRVSHEERNCPKAGSEENTTDKGQDKTKENHTEKGGVEKRISTSSVQAVPPEKVSQTSQDPHKDSPQRPNLVEQTDPAVKESVSKSAPSSSTPTSRDNTRNPISIKPTHSDYRQTGDDEDEDGDDDDEEDDDDDDVVVVSVKPATQKTPPVSAVQKPLTTFAGFQPASKVKGQQGDPRVLHSVLTAQLQQKKATLSAVNLAALPDKGERLRTQVKELEDTLDSLSITAASQPGSQGGGTSGAAGPVISQFNPFGRPGGTILLPAPQAPGPSRDQASSSSLGLQMSQGHSQMYGANPQVQSFYGGRMTSDRLLAVKNATCETIDHLHKSMESCPDTEAETADPKGIKVTLLAHQRRALAWLLWRENQNPCGGILADDMGLGKTLTMIALILATKIKTKEEEKKEEKKLEDWVSKADSSLVVSKGTLIICPASLIHHWTREIERHVKTGRLTVYLYHGPNREKSARVLADYDVVVTTYSLVSKEIPVQKEDAQKPSKDDTAVTPCSAPLLRVTWARVVLDEAHNIKNPKVQTSMAVCQLRADARWAVTGTPIQNNLLDMYSLLKFLRCSPFDEYKVWKAQVNNGSNRGRERLNILTRTLLLRRTKDQRDSKGRPLVSLPDRTCEVHQLKLSQDEKAVYDVVFAQSRSTLQNYLKRHEGKDVKTGNASTSNPFDKAQEFGMSQADPAVSSSQQPRQASSTVHILSLLLRLRQCCCHLSLLKKTLDTSELQGDGIVLSLEEQLNALSLCSGPSSSSDPHPTDTVALNGTRFPSRLFEDASESTKIAAIISELEAIRQQSDDQKSVIVSQWTSMLKIVAVHLRRMGLRYGVIDGTVNPKHRMDLVEEFNTNPDGPQVMLVSLCAGGVGLNLIGGNHLFLIDMHWNPALEDQACDRIYRVGQSKDVTIHRFVCDGTVEEKISTLQARKKQLAQNVLSGTGSTFTKLSLADLRIIFGV